VGSGLVAVVYSWDDAKICHMIARAKILVEKFLLTKETLMHIMYLFNQYIAHTHKSNIQRAIALPAGVAEEV